MLAWLITMALASSPLEEHYARGDYARAEAAATAQLDSADPEAHLDALEMLGRVAMARGELTEGYQRYQQALAWAEQAFGPGHPLALTAQQNLATVQYQLGDSAAALERQRAAVDGVRALAGDGSPGVVAKYLLNLALMEKAAGDYEAAMETTFEARDLAVAAHGREHADVALALSNLGSLLTTLEGYDTAAMALEQALDIRQAILPSDHPDLAATAHNLAVARHLGGDPAGAVPAYEGAIATWTTAFGPQHPDVAWARRNLARALLETGEAEAARQQRDLAWQADTERLALLDVLSDRESLQALAKLRHGLDDWLESHTAPAHAERAWQEVRRLQGASAAKARRVRERARLDPNAAALAVELDGVRTTRAAALFSTTDPAEALALERQQEALERALREAAPEALPAPASAATLCAALPEATALVHLYATDTGYRAFVLGQDCAVSQHALPSLDTEVRAWRRSLDSLEERTLRAAAPIIAALAPVRAAADEATSWLVVPDGALATLPWGALADGDGRYWLEDRSFVYLDRPDELLREAPIRGTGATLVGDVAHGQPDPQAWLPDCLGAPLAPLPGTAAELREVRRFWRGPRTVLEGAAATEAALSTAMAGRDLVHIATHGYLAPERCAAVLTERLGRVDPLWLSGLALAGANAAPGEDDGVLTAAEVAAIDLTDTRLVVLSACQTGLGEAVDGQGVLGLRRSFAIAGARTLVLSLWPVEDAATAALMTELYRQHLRRGRPVADALRSARLSLLARQRAAGEARVRAWAAFIPAGDWR